MTTIKKLETAQKILQHIKKLDEQIIALEGLAETAARGETITQLSLIIRDLRPRKENYVDSYEQIEKAIQQQMSHYGLQHIQFVNPFGRPDPALKSLIVDITDVVMLKVMAVILEDRQQERQDCINKLQKLGFKL